MALARTTLSLLLGLLFSATVLSAAEKFEPKVLPIGAAAPDFSLPGVDDKTHTLGDYKDAKLLLVLFTCNHCPTAQAYESRVLQIYNDYHDKGLALVAISPNDPKALRLDELGYTDVSDDLPAMKIRAEARHYPFPYLYDGDTQSVAKAYGCLATPHVFLFDADRKLRYTGRIDDSEVKTVKHQDLRNAIDALLAGKAVAVEKTPVFGCSTKWAYKQDDVASYLAKVDAEPVNLSDIDLAGMKKLIRNDTDKYILLNFWASWCGECTAELSQFTTMHRMYGHRLNFDLVMVSMDDPEARAAAMKILKEEHLGTTNYIFGGDRDAMQKAIDREWEGPIPHTLLIAPGGKIVYRHTGSIDPLEVRAAVADHIGRTYANTPKAR